MRPQTLVLMRVGAKERWDNAGKPRCKYMGGGCSSHTGHVRLQWSVGGVQFCWMSERVCMSFVLFEIEDQASTPGSA